MRRPRRADVAVDSVMKRGAASTAIQPSHGGPTLIVLAALVSTATLVAFWPALKAGAVVFDDYEYVHENPLVQNPSWKSAGRFLSEVLAPSTVGGYYQPLSMISLMIDYALGGRPNGYRVFHATSLALHIGCTLLVICLVQSLFRSDCASAAAGLIFGLHPGAVESVAWVSDRKTLLASLFALASLLAYVRFARVNLLMETWGRAGWYALCCFLFLLALLSKPTVTPLPIFMLLLDVWPLRRISKRAVVEKLPLLALAVAFVVITVISQGRTADLANPQKYPLWATPLILCHNIVFYLFKICWPIRLSAYYPWPEPFNLSQPAVQIGLVGTLALFAVLIVSLRWTRALAVGWLMFFIVLLPAMGIIGFTSAIAADRFAYLPKVGLILIVAGLLCAALNDPRVGFPARAALVALVLSIGGAEVVLTRAYLSHWSDTEGFFRYMTSLHPRSAYLRSNLGNVLNGAGKTDEAIEQYREALRLDEDPAAHGGLAALLAAKGQLAEAEQHLRESVRLYPKNVTALENLAIVLDRQNKADEAAKYFNDALRLKPDSISTHFNYGLSLFRRGKFDEAAAHFADALRVEPNHAAVHYQLGRLLVSQGKTREGLDHWRAALRVDSSSVQTMIALAWVLATVDEAQLRDGSEAVRIAEHANQLTGGDDPTILDTLAAAYAEAGRMKDAVETARKSVARWTALNKRAEAQDVGQRLQAYETGLAYHEPIRRESYLAR